jgi:hypothetical protein
MDWGTKLVFRQGWKPTEDADLVLQALLNRLPEGEASAACFGSSGGRCEEREKSRMRRLPHLNPKTFSIEQNG